MNKIVLNGITWGHSRGITPLLAFSQRFTELHPNVEVVWKKRTLQEFADYPIELLTRHYDLLVIDHPWAGCAAATKSVLPLEQHLPAEFLQDQEENSVGHSHQSYRYNDHQWALAIDAATPVASYRNDLFEAAGENVPQTWDDLLSLARRGKVAVPAIPIDLLMNFYTFCIAHGGEPFQTERAIIDDETGILALQTMRELYALVDESMFARNPIAVAEAMSSSNDYWYCPFAYGYSNYARTGYAENLLHYNDGITFGGKKLSTTLGGTGLAVSAFSEKKEWALAFAKSIASPVVQRTFYVEHGGQPGHLSAWNDEAANRLCHNYFRNTLPALERSYMRPRYNGYLYFQDEAGEPLQRYLRDGGSPEKVIAEMNVLYRRSMAHQSQKTYA